MFLPNDGCLIEFAEFNGIRTGAAVGESFERVAPEWFSVALEVMD